MRTPLTYSVQTYLPPKSCVSLFLLMSLSLILFFGCEGPVGPPGHDAPGIDIVPPTIVMTQPWPLSEVWDEFVIRAAAVDNVAIREVIFSIDGASIFDEEVLFDDVEPFEVEIDALLADSTRLIEVGWHFISARAYDTAGNVTDAAPIPIHFSYSDDLKDTILVSHHNGLAVAEWSLPDTAGTKAFWARFNTPKDTELLSIKALLRGVYTDTTGFSFTVGIWEGTSIPSTIITQDTLYSDTLSAVSDTLMIIFNSEEAIEVENDFFVVIGYLGGGENDSLVIMADDGKPYWGRCGSIDDLGTHTLGERFSVGNNFIIECQLDYGGSD